MGLILELTAISLLDSGTMTIQMGTGILRINRAIPIGNLEIITTKMVTQMLTLATNFMKIAMSTKMPMPGIRRLTTTATKTQKDTIKMTDQCPCRCHNQKLSKVKLLLSFTTSWSTSTPMPSAPTIQCSFRQLNFQWETTASTPMAGWDKDSRLFHGTHSGSQRSTSSRV